MSGPLLATNDVPACPAWLMPLAGAVPLAYYVAGASGFVPGFQDAALVGSAAELGVGPPPGSPLSALVASLLTLLPIGPLSFRVATASALFVALTLALFARALFTSLVGLGVRRTELAAALALAAAGFVAQTPAAFHVATHANVFALEWLLTMAILDAIVRYELSEPTEDLRLLNYAAFVQGLAFANHYVLALLTLPAAAPTLGRVFARRGFIGLMGHAALPLFGASAYVYVPIRAAQHPLVDFGEASSLGRLFAMVSAEPFWVHADDVRLGAMFEGFAQAAGAAWPLLALLAVLGVLLARRVHGLRRFAVVWALLLALPFAGAALLVRPLLVADRHGALLPCLFGAAALAALALGLLSESRDVLRQGRLPVSFARALAACALAALALFARARSDPSGDAADALADASLRALPQGALVLTHHPDTLMTALALQVEERTRPDVQVVLLSPMDPSPLERLVLTHPELSPVLRDVVVRGGPSLAALQTLAGERTLVLELDRRVFPELYPTLLPAGLFVRVLADGATPGDERVAVQETLPVVARLAARLARVAPAPDLAQRIAERAFYQGLQTASLGDREGARAFVSLARSLAKDDARALALAGALEREGMVDVVQLGGFAP